MSWIPILIAVVFNFPICLADDKGSNVLYIAFGILLVIMLVVFGGSVLIYYLCCGIFTLSRLSWPLKILNLQEDKRARQPKPLEQKQSDSQPVLTIDFNFNKLINFFASSSSESTANEPQANMPSRSIIIFLYNQ